MYKALKKSRLLLLTPFFFLSVLPSAHALNAEDARHLLDRTAFGGNKTLKQHIYSLDRHSAVSFLLSRKAKRSKLPLFSKSQPKDRKQRQKQRKKQGHTLKQWWLKEMFTTEDPFQERMTLFWHGHFTSGLKKVRNPALMAQQNTLLYTHATGDFSKLLNAIAKDPAMLIYLDGRANRKNKPNENFARELLELFTLGEGKYTESDIKAAARAFTGWSLNKQKAFVFRKRQHDPSKKTFLNRTAHFKGEDILTEILKQPDCARWIVSRLWLTFISPTPDTEQVNNWAKDFQHNWQLMPLLKTMLKSDAFWAQENRETLVKSPIELTIGSWHEVKNNQNPPWKKVWRLQRNLGQDIFSPPNVKGWPGGLNWLDSQRLSQRQQFVNVFFKRHSPDSDDLQRFRDASRYQLK